MKSIKLSQAKREDIVLSVLKAWEVNNPEPNLLLARNNAFMSYYKLAYKDIEKYLENPTLRPFYRTGSKILVQVAGDMVEFRLVNVPPVPLPTHGNGCHTPCIYVCKSRTNEHATFVEVEDQHRDWNAERYELRKETTSIINTCNNTGQLVELWPEIEPLLPAYLSDPSRGVSLPSIPVSRLNERLGLKEIKKGKKK